MKSQSAARSPFDDISPDAPLDSSAARSDNDTAPQWVWVLVRAGERPGDGVWVCYPAEQAPEGLDVRPARRPAPGSLGVLVLRAPDVRAPGLESLEDGPPPKRVRARAAASTPRDRNLVTVAEFAAALDMAQSTVFDLLKRGLPSVKTKGLGRRILKQQAEAWLVNGGPERSRAAKKLAKAQDRANTTTANGASRG